MNQSEETIVRNVVRALRAGRDGQKVTCSPEIAEMLNSRAFSIWAETWVIGALECMLPEQRDLKLGVSLSR